MKEELKGELLDTVKAVVEKDILEEEDALKILAVCKAATDRKIADVSERIMMERISGGEAE